LSIEESRGVSAAAMVFCRPVSEPRALGIFQALAHGILARADDRERFIVIHA